MPTAPLLAELRAGDHPVASFQAVRLELDARNRPVADDKPLRNGGAVWYVTVPALLVRQSSMS